MRHRRTAFLLACAILVIGSKRSGAQSSPSSAIPDTARSNSLDSHLVLIAETKDSSSELAPSDLEIRVDGSPVVVTGLKKLGRVPVRYCVLFDISGSERGKFRAQVFLAATVLSQVISADTDRGWADLFSDEVQETTEAETPQEIIGLLRQQSPNGGTSLYDAMARCSERMQRAAAEGEQRVMFVFSDGDDDASRITQKQAGELLIGAGIRVYALATEFGQRGKRIFETLCRLTGGRLLLADDKGSMKHAGDRIVDDLISGVEVSYTTPARKPKSGMSKIQAKCRAKGIAVLAAEEVQR